MATKKEPETKTEEKKTDERPDNIPIEVPEDLQEFIRDLEVFCTALYNRKILKDKFILDPTENDHDKEIVSMWFMSYRKDKRAPGARKNGYGKKNYSSDKPTDGGGNGGNGGNGKGKPFVDDRTGKELGTATKGQRGYLYRFSKDGLYDGNPYNETMSFEEAKARIEECKRKEEEGA